MSETALLLDSVFLDHDPGPGHPESMARYHAVTEALKQSGLRKKCAELEVRKAKDEELCLAHEEAYVELVKREILAGRDVLSTGDTSVGERSLDVGLRATGSALAAVDGVMQGKFQQAFCAVRPPGHHATPDRGMGFCLFNHVAVAARYAQKKFGVERVAIVDWDVHHGNGTQDIFYQDESVFFCSTHQYPWYPGTGAKAETGEGKGEGTTMNVPLPSGSGIGDIGPALQRDFSQAMADFRPDLLLVSAGFDSRLGDPLGQFTLTDDNFATLTRVLLEVAHRHCDGRLVSVMEGGYNVDGLGKAVVSHVNELTQA